RIPDERWESQKSNIRHLYLVENKPLEGENGVIDTMGMNHDFSASKAQYETRLKKWGFRKYATKDEWCTIDHILDMREDKGKPSEVHLHGELLTDEKIRKERRR
ncbi:hypothetical protein K505DRAFT_221623, partial [Melanomma pulvis-pyrius CBS 109.77]